MISLQNVHKNYGKHQVLKDISFNIEPGSIVGLLGPNGAGKTTLIRALLGLSQAQGNIEVLSMNPAHQRHKLLAEVSHVSDVAVLPGWLKAGQVVDYIEGVHPRFDRQKAMRLLEQTNVKMDKKVKQLSKGMVAQLHLSCILAIDVSLLILDEPTLGLDILYRKQFYQQLVTEFFDQQKTILISSHQIDELEHILSHAMFIKQGEVVLHQSMEEISDNFCSVTVNEAQSDLARKLQPIYEKPGLGTRGFIFEGKASPDIEALGAVVTPSISDIFTAIMQENK